MEADPVAITNGLAAAGNLINSLIGLAKTANDRTALSEAYSAVLSAQSGALALQQNHSALLKQKDALETELVELKNWPAEAKKYDAKEVVVGAFAYVKKASEGGVSDRMYFCANCFERREKTILNQRNVPVGRWKYLDCPRCKAILTIEGGGVQPVPS